MQYNMQVCVCVLGFSLTEQDTWWPRSLLTALISLEISKLGTCAEEGRYAPQLSGPVLRLSLFIAFCLHQLPLSCSATEFDFSDCGSQRDAEDL